MTTLEIVIIFSTTALLLAGNILAWRSAAMWMRSKEALFVVHRSTVDELHQAQKALYETATEREYQLDRACRLQRTVDQQKNLIEKQKSLIDTLVAAGPSHASPRETLIDDKTASLVRLAISNNQEHEQHAAAMLACRRIADRLREK
jgi:hypothetical protein